jgi:metal-sulfur cluster biosynthetic enzyme
MSEEQKVSDASNVSAEGAASIPPPTKEGFLEWLSPIEDPELFLKLTDLGLIYEVTLIDAHAHVKMTLTSPGCPAADQLVNDVKKRMLEYPGVREATVLVVFEPKWDPSTMASDEVKDRLGIW